MPLLCGNSAVHAPCRGVRALVLTLTAEAFVFPNPQTITNPTMTELYRSFVARATACLAVAILPPLSDQTAATSADVSPPAEDVLKLNPFAVSTDKNRGYAASSTLAGTRLNTSLRDVAAAVTVITPEFMADLGDEFDFTSAQALRMNRDFFRPVAKTESLSIAIV